ncbi:MAG: IclR family transcriptional regulator [Rhodobacteraceae bacterium]|nr:IclR family transcriptional regulator [Paracoccaceae bacterium]MCW9041780.1 IclR family transcriptional regulator [Pseudopelagicola sp.]
MRKRTGDSGESNAVTGDRQFITSLQRGLDVLRAFRPEDRVGLSNGDIAARTGLPNSTISRLTYTLLKTGYLLYDKETGRYRMGVPVLSLGYACLSALPIRDTAQGYMQDLADECGEGVQVALGGRVDFTMIYLAAARSKSVISLQLDVGSRISLARSAMGRAYIAASPPDEKAALLEGIERRTDPSLWPSIHAGFARAEEEIATRGFYGNIGEWQPGVNAVAVPFQSKQGNTPLMAFNLGGPASYLPKDEMLGTYGPRLVQMVETLRQSAI